MMMMNVLLILALPVLVVNMKPLLVLQEMHAKSQNVILQLDVKTIPLHVMITMPVLMTTAILNPDATTLLLTAMMAMSVPRTLVIPTLVAATLPFLAKTKTVRLLYVILHLDVYTHLSFAMITMNVQMIVVMMMMEVVLILLLIVMMTMHVLLTLAVMLPDVLILLLYVKNPTPATPYPAMKQKDVYMKTFPMIAMIQMMNVTPTLAILLLDVPLPSLTVMITMLAPVIPATQILDV
jgi:hypothetical protein